jgi:hypothetical protein
MKIIQDSCKTRVILCIILHNLANFGPISLGIEVEGFCHLSQNGINFLSGQVLLIGLNKNEKSTQGEVIDTHVFDHVPGRLLRKKTTFKESSVHAIVIQNGLILPGRTALKVVDVGKSHPRY